MDRRSAIQSYKEFMRAQRPRLHADKRSLEGGEKDWRLFKFPLQSLKNERREAAFDNCSRSRRSLRRSPSRAGAGGDESIGEGDLPVDAAYLQAMWWLA